MITPIEVPEKKDAQVPRRKKLWEGTDGYHCSIIGTCLRREEIRKLARKKIYGLHKGMSDFKIHSNLVNMAAQRCPQSRALQKLLDSKYRQAIKKYSKAKDDDAIEDLWQRDQDNGSIAGAYWAVMTHPHISKDLRSKIYGQIHMCSHDFFVFNNKEKKAMEDLEVKVTMLEEVMVSERQLLLQEKKQLRHTQDQLNKVIHEKQNLTTENIELQRKIEELTSGNEFLFLEQRVEALKESLIEARQENAALQGLEEETRQLFEQNIEQLEQAKDIIEKIEFKNKALTEERDELNLEVISMEATLNYHHSQITNDCDLCMDQNSERCPGPDLCGKTILYVGGKVNMVPRYRKLVENMGGNFIYHDGGKEASRTILPKMLHTADAVLCPVDCISHDATNCVKRICKRRQKPFVMMRSSGLSSLARGLNEIVQ